MDDIDSLVATRRSALSPDQRTQLQDERWGLALSGGGIRSATFCLGLCRSLAAKRVFHRFDLMSTVSGGGYVGAMMGRLFHAELPREGPKVASEAVETALGEADRRWFVWWLRANGRYLVPHGTLDGFFAGATFGRNLLAVHIELALIAIMLGLALAGIDVQAWGQVHEWWVALDPHARKAGALLAWLTGWPTPWLLLPVIAWLALLVACTYWSFPGDNESRIPQWRWLAVLVSVFAIVLVRDFWEPLTDPDLFHLSQPVLTIASGILVTYVLATLLADVLTWRREFDFGWLRSWSKRHRVRWWLAAMAMTVAAGAADYFAWRKVPAVFAIALTCLLVPLVAAVLAWKDKQEFAVVRNRLTRALCFLLIAAACVFVAGAIDYYAWQLALGAPKLHAQIGGAIAIGGVALRALLPKIAELPRSSTPVWRHLLATILNLAGLMVLIALIIFWASVVHRLVTLRIFELGADHTLALPAAWYTFDALATAALLFFVISASNVNFPNKTSLYTFYKARLTRSYLGAANAQRLGVHSSLDTVPPVRPNGFVVEVNKPHAQDDIEMEHYAPHLHGGPVHLINVCANQTRDPRGGLFNQDRKGLLLTIGPQRRRLGSSDWGDLPASRSMTLGSWMAISGAAVSPGMGGSTRPGIAALAMMGGVRLGYWWEERKSEGHWRRFGKYGLILSELLGRFDIERKAPMFLSDGGHFENTAAYALLRERCRLVVLADCGADPRYAFGDIENLVRKARIDLHADIKFLKPKTPLNRGWEAFGSLSDIASTESSACLGLARIDYGDTAESGYLIVVKPTTLAGLPVDLVNFKADNPEFPQEPTADQFFDEAQWESYFRLGSILGEHLTPDVLLSIAQVAQKCFELDDGAVTAAPSAKQAGPVAAAAAAAAAAPAVTRRLPARIVATGAVTASVSLGAIASLAVTAFQAINSEAKQRQAARTTDPAELKDLSDLYAKVVGAGRDEKGKAAANLAIALTRVAEHACAGSQVQAYRSSATVQSILQTARDACKQADARDAEACKAMLNPQAATPGCLAPAPRGECTPHYWIRDYVNDPKNCTPNIAKAPDATPPAAAASHPAAATTASAPRTVSSAPPLEERGAGVRRAIRSNPAFTATVAPQGASVPASAAQDSANANACRGKTIYIQIYGPEQRSQANDLIAALSGTGALVPLAEDVTQTARQNNRPAPAVFGAPTIIEHQPELQPCAERVRTLAAEKLKIPPSAWQIKRLSFRLQATAGVLEVWLPPVSAK